MVLNVSSHRVSSSVGDSLRSSPLFDDISRDQACCSAAATLDKPPSKTCHWRWCRYQTGELCSHPSGLLPNLLEFSVPYLCWSYLTEYTKDSEHISGAHPCLPLSLSYYLFSGLGSLSALDLLRVPLPALWPGNTLRHYILNLRLFSISPFPVIASQL